MGAAVACALAMAGPAAGAQPAELVRKDIGVGGVMSANVTYLGTLANDAPGVGGKLIRMPGGEQRFFVTGHKGISIYRVTDPAHPVLLGLLPFPHSQNEDVEVSADGSRLFIAADGSSIVPTLINGGTHMFDVSDPANIKLLASHTDFNHTVECADAACNWVYGQKGWIYEVQSNPPALVRRGRWAPDYLTTIHALYRDGAGYMVSDSDPRLVLDVRDPRSPKVVASGSPIRPDGVIQHNNVRPNAQRWKPRNPKSRHYDDPQMRPGELLLATSEHNQTQDCSTAGGLSTWSMVNFDKGTELKQLHVLRPVRGTAWEGGNPPANVNGCSAHWFTYRDGIVAAAWFEHGARFFRIDERNGEIEQIGYFNPLWTSAAAAHWIVAPDGTEYVYSVDYARGIDILRFDRRAPRPRASAVEDSWKGAGGRTSPLAAHERTLCRLATR